MTASAKQFLLRVEGVNLSNVLDDTSEISIRRSSGLMLRAAIEQIIKKQKGLKKISTGASVGLFSFIADNPESIQNDVVNLLNDEYQYLTFVVDIESYIPTDSNSFKQAHEKVIAKNRYRQFQQMTLVAPEFIQNTSKVCQMTYLHPADNKGKVNKKENVSASCRYRFNQGRALRQKFYEDELKDKMDVRGLDFTDNLEELARPDTSQNYNNLNDKIAVIYLDGNGFGKIQKSCKNKEELQNFDEKNQNYRRLFLKELLIKISGDMDMKNAAGKIRLETLLWGGDEMIFVVPAWKGMEVLRYFYDISKDWNYKDKSLSYAGGIVFCQHNTPISQIIKAAKDLAESVKNSENGRKANYFDYLVLESVDYPTQPVEQYWALRYGEQTKKQFPALTPKNFPPDLNEILDSLPRGSIYDIGQHWVLHWKSKNHQSSQQLEERITRFKAVDKDAYNTLFDKVFPLLADQLDRKLENQYKNPAWLHLVELWDYLAPVNSKEGQ